MLTSMPRNPREVHARLRLQTSNPINISAFCHLLADLNAAWEKDGRREAAVSLKDRIEQFRLDWMCGLHSRVKPLELLGDDDDEQYSQGGETAFSSQETTASSALSFVTASEGSAAIAVTRPLQSIPVDPVLRGVLAEETIKADLRRLRDLVEHEDYSSLAQAAKHAMKRTLKTRRPAYVSPGLIDSVDWTAEYKARGWATPGVRWGVFKPDLLRFEEVKHDAGDGKRVVAWEVVEVKYSGGTRSTVYTNWKVQALFYHLTLARILSRVPDLVPSHKVTFFVSRNPLSTRYEETSGAVRTTQAFAEQHLFDMLPRWLEAVKEGEWKKLQEALEQQTPSTPSRGLPPTFLEKLQQSAKSAPPSPSRPRHPSSVLRFTSPTKPSLLRPLDPAAPSSPSPDTDDPPSPSLSSSRLFSSSASAAPIFPPFLPVHATVFPPPDALPPLPPVDEEEERELQALFERIGIE
ncbi:hypothetical protein JCM10207_001303 [Rhodosporidiobolus poonsookiae]